MKNRFVSFGTAMILLALTVGLPLSAPTASAKKKSAATRISVVPTITNLSIVNGQLVAAGTATAVIRGRTTTASFSGVPVEIAVAANQPGAICPVLDVRLGVITLDLLGLSVQTSPVCLTLTAIEGGGSLANMPCGIGGLLNQGLSLNQALATLNPTQLNSVRGGLIHLLNGALSQLGNAVLTAINQGGTQGSCAVLHLELVPLNQTVLGLNVMLDNCGSGPVTVDIAAITGRGHVLGDRLCNLLGRNSLNLQLTLQNILNQLAGVPPR